MRWILVEVRQCFENRMHFAVFFLAAVFACCYAAPNKYIWSGEEVDQAEFETSFSYQVSVQWVKLGAVYHICGGAIVHKNYIVTANHCCRPEYKDYLHVVVNEVNVKIENQNDKKLIKVESMKQINLSPPEPGNYKIDDICLLQVAKDLTENIIDMSDDVNPPPSDLPNTKYTLTGWGYYDKENEMSPNLKKTTDLIILSRKKTGLEDITRNLTDDSNWSPYEEVDECKQTLTNLGFSGDLLQPNNICTKSVDVHTTCNGDSGGPLVYFDGVTPKPKLVGVVSWGINACDQAGIPNIYTNIAPYAAEIRSKFI